MRVSEVQMAVEATYVMDRLHELCVDARSTICGDRTNPLFRMMLVHEAPPSVPANVHRVLSSGMALREKIPLARKMLSDHKEELAKEIFDLYDLSRVIE